MKLIQWSDTDAYFNLAAEEFIFEHLDRGEEYLLLWQNRNAIVVGVHQNTCEEIINNLWMKTQFKSSAGLQGEVPCIMTLGI